MINPFTDVNWRPDVAAKRTFARSLMIGFPAIALVFLLAGWMRTGTWDLSLALGLGGGGLAVGVVLFALPGIARPFYTAWYAVACAIGFVVGNVFLLLLFYVIVTGTAWARRLVGRRSLETSIDRSRSSYWEDAGPRPPAARYLRQF